MHKANIGSKWKSGTLPTLENSYGSGRFAKNNFSKKRSQQSDAGFQPQNYEEWSSGGHNSRGGGKQRNSRNNDSDWANNGHGGGKFYQGM